VARQSPHRPDANEPQAGAELAGGGGRADRRAEAERGLEGADGTAGEPDRSLWEDVRVDPVELALPAGAGFTLRAYRPAGALTPTDVSGREEDDVFAGRSRQALGEDDETVVILDEEFAALSDEPVVEEDVARRRAGRDETEAEAEAEPGEDEAEDVPVFLGHRGKLLLFKTPESLVSFVRSGSPNDLTQLDTWSELAERIDPRDIAPLDEDSYELDLVVENLRGGHDAWDPTLIISAGEVARDLAYALRLPAVLDMLSSGSSLDDLDEALRSTVSGGLGGFRGRRRLRRIGAQTASLGWRTIIGKISAAVDWRD
jgi:hypothetical protein